MIICQLDLTLILAITDSWYLRDSPKKIYMFAFEGHNTNMYKISGFLFILKSYLQFLTHVIYTFLPSI